MNFVQILWKVTDKHRPKKKNKITDVYETEHSFRIRIDTLSYSLKGERGAPGPKGMSALVGTS